MYQHNYSRRHNKKVVRCVYRIIMNARDKKMQDTGGINNGKSLGSELKKESSSLNLYSSCILKQFRLY